MDKLLFALHTKLLCLNHQQSFGKPIVKVETANAIYLIHIAICATKVAGANKAIMALPRSLAHHFENSVKFNFMITFIFVGIGCKIASSVFESKLQSNVQIFNLKIKKPCSMQSKTERHFL